MYSTQKSSVKHVSFYLILSKHFFFPSSFFFFFFNSDNTELSENAIWGIDKGSMQSVPI